MSEEQHMLMGSIRGSRFAHIEEGLRNVAPDFGVTIQLQVQKHLLTKTVYYTVTGPLNNVNQFHWCAQKAVE